MRCRLRRKFRRETGEQRRERDGRAFRRERAGLEPRQIEKLRELQIERFRRCLHAADERAPIGSRAPVPQAPRRTVRVREAVGANRGSPLRATGSWRDWPASAATVRLLRRARALAKFADQVDVFVPHRERLRQHVVQPVPEAEDECQHDRHHALRYTYERVSPTHATRTISGTSAGRTKP